MKGGTTVLAIVLALGLANAPFTVRAHDEAGEKGEHKAHHEASGEPAHEGAKKEAQSKGEAKKTSAAAGASAEHHDGHGMPGDEHEEMEEGSH